MGNSPSGIETVNEVRGGKSRARAKRNIFAGWQNRQIAKHVFAVVRHAERADSLCALYNGARWTQTDDFARWPTDPPLSDAGVEAADKVGAWLHDHAAASGSLIHVVVTSPYMRCVQTAAGICQALGSRVRLLVDYSLGEVFGPDIMGPTEPMRPIRPWEQTKAQCERRGILCHKAALGKWPRWPEDVGFARQRYVTRFLTYLHRGELARRNFVLVTHGDCVGATLQMLPSQANRTVDSVGYGGLFLGTRKPNKSASSASSQKADPSEVPFGAVLPTEVQEQTQDEVESPSLWDLQTRPAKKIAWGVLEKQETSYFDDPTINANGDDTVEMPAVSPKPSAAWKICVYNIAQRKVVKGKLTTKGLSTRLQRIISQTKFTPEHIERLLGVLPKEPLGYSDCLDSHKRSRDDRHSMANRSLSSTLSRSTCVFGASEEGPDTPRSWCTTPTETSTLQGPEPGSWQEQDDTSPRQNTSWRTRSPHPTRAKRQDTWGSIEQLTRSVTIEALGSFGPNVDSSGTPPYTNTRHSAKVPGSFIVIGDGSTSPLPIIKATSYKALGGADYDGDFQTMSSSQPAAVKSPKKAMRAIGNLQGSSLMRRRSLSKEKDSVESNSDNQIRGQST